MVATRQEGATVKPLSDGTAFVEGAYVPIGEARLPLLDWGFTRSTSAISACIRKPAIRFHIHIGREPPNFGNKGAGLLYGK